MATRYIGRKEMCQLTGKSYPTLWRMYAKNKEFPAPQKSASGRFLGWPEHVYEAWVQQQSRN
nr:AlpA family phage regulatory protein [Pectobacterium carotovorum]